MASSGKTYTEANLEEWVGAERQALLGFAFVFQV